MNTRSALAQSTEVLQRIVYAKYPVAGALRTDRQSLNRKFMIFFRYLDLDRTGSDISINTFYHIGAGKKPANIGITT